MRLATLLRIASEISARVNAILDPDALFRAVIPLLKEGFDLYYVHVYLLDAGRRELRLRAGYGEAAQQMLARSHKIPLDAEVSLVARAARSRAPVVANDVAADPGFLPNALLPDTRAELAIPMIVGDEVLGVFDIQDDTPNAFAEAHVDVFLGLAGQIATALQNARFVERIERTLAQTRARLAMGQALARAQTEDAVLDALVAQAAQVDDAMVVVALADDRGDGRTPAVARCAPFASGLAPAGLARGAGFALAQVVAEGGPFVSDDVAGDARLTPDQRALLEAWGVRSLLVCPLRAHDARPGAVAALAPAPGAFDAARRFHYETLAELGAPALQEAHLRDQLSFTQFSVDQAPAAIIWIRPDGTFHSVNATACELLGYTRDELLALPSMSHLDPNMIPGVWKAHWRKVKADRRFVIETEYRTKQGTLVPVEVTANYLEYGGQEYNCVFAQDITERQQAASTRERFTVQLRTAAEIAEQVGAIRTPDTLLQTVIPLLKERFELYHAHIYVLEDEDLVLRAGYGRIGQLMVQQGHKIPLRHPYSLVARAARTREPVLVNDVATAPDFLPNLLLPRTQAEVAVPLVMGDRVLGVFDVQADQVDFFTQSDLDAFRTLAGQLANAFYSALLFEQQQTAQHDLRKAAETVRAVFDAMTEGVMVIDIMGRITDVNPAALALHGYTRPEELVGRSAVELVTKPSWPRMAESMRQALESGAGDVAEYRMVRQDGTIFDAEQSYALLGDWQGNPRGLVLITRDITERKRARQEIARFLALAENATDAIFMADFSGHITYANRAADQLFASEAGGLVGKLLPGLWPESEAHILLDEALPAAGDAGWQGEVPQVRLDRTTFQAALTLFAVRGEKGEPLSLGAIVRDVTERQRAQADLQRFALQLRTAAEVSAQVNTILDPNALLEAVVPLVQARFAVYHLHVYTLDRARGELVMRVGSGEAGRTMRERGHTIALDRRPSLVAKAARTGETVLVKDVLNEPDHMRNPLLPETRTEVAIPMLAGDEVMGVFDVQDSVPGRFSESEVDVFKTLAAQIGIALRNARYFEEMQQVAERLREVDRLKSEFLANMSHELRTPLNSILGYAEVMLMGIDGELTSDMQEDVEAIFENGQQLLRLINDVLDLTKIEAGRMSLNTELVAVPPLLEEARNHNLGLLRKEAKPVEVLVEAEEGLPLVPVDPVRFSQILNNLVSNAIKFTAEGTVVLRARLDSAGGHLCVDVVDTGVGIAADDVARLFERFHQVDGSTTRRAEGTGLGLAITKHLVELHGGHLAVQSEPGRGSTFTVSLPLAVSGEGA